MERVVEVIKERGYHNHRTEDHSDVLSDLLLDDLRATCPSLARDLGHGVVQAWKNVRTPGGRKRKIDLLIAEPVDRAAKKRQPDLKTMRLAIEHKSVVTAHRNRDARFDDLRGVLETAHREKAEAVIAATVLIGTASRVLNVPDRVAPLSGPRFLAEVRSRLSTGDTRLWDEFPVAISKNRLDDPKKTVDKFRALPRRPPAMTHIIGFDELLLVPVHIDNVSPPYLDRKNALGIDIDADYRNFQASLCKAYTARWHP